MFLFKLEDVFLELRRAARTAVVEHFIGKVATIISVVAEKRLTDALEVVAFPLTRGASCNSQHANAAKTNYQVS